MPRLPGWQARGTMKDAVARWVAVLAVLAAFAAGDAKKWPQWLPEQAMVVFVICVFALMILAIDMIVTAAGWISDHRRRPIEHATIDDVMGSASVHVKDGVAVVTGKVGCALASLRSVRLALRPEGTTDERAQVVMPSAIVGCGGAFRTSRPLPPSQQMAAATFDVVVLDAFAGLARRPLKHGPFRSVELEREPPPRTDDELDDRQPR